MLHTKFQGNWPAGSEEIGLPVPEQKIFKGFLPYMSMAAILVI